MPQAAPLSLTDLPTVLKDQVINIADRLSGFHMQSSFANINLLSICRSHREIAQNRASEKYCGQDGGDLGGTYINKRRLFCVRTLVFSGGFG